MISSLELARLCGVSQGTVDRALHNRKGVSEATKQKILAAAAQYGYQPNPVARELMTGKSHVVGMLIPQFNRFFLMDLADVIKTRLSEQGLRLFLCTVSNEQEMKEIIHDFSARRARAVVLIPPGNDVSIPTQLTKTLRVVTLLNRCKGDNTTFICPDEFKTGTDAVELLYQAGHTNIVHLTYERSSYSINSREAGYVAQMQKRNLTPRVIRKFEPKQMLQFIQVNRVTAVFCHNDWLAYSLLQLSLRNGLSVPEDLAILGVDNSPSFAEICSEISSLEYPFEWVAQQIGQVLSTQTGYQPVNPPPFRLVKRATFR